MKTCLFSLFAVACLCVGFESFVAAQEKRDPVVLKGKICCAKCELEISKNCASVIVVKENGKDMIYYFDTKSNEKYHAETCSESRKGEATGVVSEAAGKKIISVSKLKFE